MNYRISKHHLLIGVLMLILIFLSDLSVFYIIIFLFAVILLMLKWKNRNCWSIFKQYFEFFLLPAVFIFVHAIFTVFVNGQDFYMLRSVSLFALAFSEMVVGIYLYSSLGKNAINIMFYTCLIKYIYEICAAIFSVGIGEFVAEIGNLGSDRLRYWLEQHDMGLTMGMFILYYLFFQDKKSKGRIARLILGLIIFALCFKRIAIGALFVAGIYCILIYKAKNHKKFIFITSIMAIVVCYAYVYIIKDGRLMQLFYTYGINPMGRNSLYKYFDEYYEFSPFFWGRGSGFTSKLLTIGARTGTGVAHILGLHSDILRAFIEYGFIGAFLWFFYYLNILTNKIYRFAGDKAAFLYLTLTVYSFVIYSTDNTSIYFIFQVAYMLLPLQLYVNKGESQMEIKAYSDFK